MGNIEVKYDYRKAVVLTSLQCYDVNESLTDFTDIASLAMCLLPAKIQIRVLDTGLWPFGKARDHVIKKKQL